MDDFTRQIVNEFISSKRTEISVNVDEFEEVDALISSHGIETYSSLDTPEDVIIERIKQPITRRKSHMSINQDPLRVVTGKVRLSFVHLFAPYARNGQEPKYSATLLIPKSDLDTKQRIDTAIQAAIQEGVEKRWSGVRPPNLPIPIYDGDGVKPSDGLPFGPECKGHWVLTASSKADRKPDIVDAQVNPIIDQTQVYSGMYAYVSIRFFAYFAAGKKGIGCGLGNVMKVADGEPLSGSTSAAQDFASLAATAPNTPPNNSQFQGYPQGYQQPPVQQPYGYQQPPVQQPPVQPGYGQQGYPQQPQVYPQAPVQQPMQYDPITGQPIGGVMGI